MPRSLMLVFTNPTSPDANDAFERWYDQKHLREVAALEGVVSATRYRIAEGVSPLPGLPTDPRQYLAVYELEATTVEGLRELIEIMQRATQSGKVDISPTLDIATASATFAIPVSERVMHSS